jgi:hypothetical protein
VRARPQEWFALWPLTRVHVMARGSNEGTVLEEGCAGEMIDDAGYAPRWLHDSMHRGTGCSDVHGQSYLYPRVVPTAGRVAESSSGSISAYRDVEHREIHGQAGSGR